MNFINCRHIKKLKFEVWAFLLRSAIYEICKSKIGKPWDIWADFLHAFFFQPHCCLTFSWIELQLLLRCCLIHISTIMLRYFFYLVHSWLRLGLGLFRSYPRDLFLIFIFIFIIINHVISLKWKHLFFFVLFFCTFF